MEYLVIASKSLVVSAILYGYYHFILRDRSSHHWNRVYLLAGSIISMLVPFLKIPLSLGRGGDPASVLGGGLRVMSGVLWEETGAGSGGVAGWRGWLAMVNGWWVLYLAGVLVGLGFLLRAVAYIIWVRRKYGYERVAGIRLYETTEKAAPFSFFGSIFWHERISFFSREGQQIFRHELYHVKKGHSLDVCWMELCSVVNWFNPFIHLMRRELMTVHEYLADENAVGASDRLGYAEMLVMQSIGMRSKGLASPMFSTMIRRRVDMIIHSGGRRAGIWRRLLVMPVLLGLLVVFGFRVVPGGRIEVRPLAEPITVVVDAGHGGIDPGAVGLGGVEEKHLTLQLAQVVNRLAVQYNVKVILTRNEDILPGNATDKAQGLKNRVAIAKQSGAVAFISLHVNNSGGDVRDGNTGFDAFVARDKRDDAGLQLANQLLGRLRNVYTVSRPVLQRDGERIYVLEHNTCPSVLLECGFIDNAKDLGFLQVEANREAIARAILQGLVDARERL